MSTTFHLRPVSRAANSSPSSSSSTVSDQTPPQHHPKHDMSAIMQQKRPLSPSSLRDLDLSTSCNVQSRKYPPPPTGHELMALFPPAPPVNVFSGPTSGFFHAEERAFFAKGGKEMVRVRIEVDMPHEDNALMSRQWPSSSSSPRSQTLSPQTSPHDPAPTSITTQHTSPLRSSGNGPVTVKTQPVLPIMSHSTPRTPYPSHERRHSIQADLEDPDEAWRRPIPHNQRRRAGKHTKRVVVK